jgi:hypothetical protein
MRKFLLFAIIISALSAVPQAVQAQAAETKSSSIFTVVKTPNVGTYPRSNNLNAVSASSANDIWAVGESGLHFDGTKWTATTLPKIAGDLSSGLTGVVDFAPNNVWGVGYINLHEAGTTQIIEHYDGTSWSVYPGPKFASSEAPLLYGLTATSPSDIWAVGDIDISEANFAGPVVEHYNGTTWTASILGTCSLCFPQAISAIAADDVWSVGSIELTSTFTMHFNGTEWFQFPSPNPGQGENVLFGLATVDTNNVWAVGFYVKDFNESLPQLTLIEHWDGTSWQVVPSPNVGGNNNQNFSNQLRGVVAVSANDVWAFGVTDNRVNGSETNLVLHWDGTEWTIVPTPDPYPFPNGTYENVLLGGTVIEGNLWLVGTAHLSDSLVLNAVGQ